MKNSQSSFVRSFGFAASGLIAAIRTERNVRVHFVLVVGVVVMGICFSVSPTEWMMIVVSCGLVIGAELMNTAIEKLTDLVNPDYNAGAGMVKDIAAGAVLICSIAAAIIGCLIFVPKLFLV